MPKLSIPHDAYVFVGDGRKALFLRNEGDEKFPNLRAERVLVDDNPRTRDQGTDRPGRGFARRGSSRRSSMETTVGMKSRSIGSPSTWPPRSSSWSGRVP
jgi:protein required for attachment to host cells